MPSAVNTASKELVNWPARSLIRNRPARRLVTARRCALSGLAYCSSSSSSTQPE